jgi:hypothetical protein
MDMAVPANTHNKTTILSNDFIRKLVKFDHHYQQTQLQPDRLHQKIKMNSDFIIEQPGNLKPFTRITRIHTNFRKPGHTNRKGHKERKDFTAGGL